MAGATVKIEGIVTIGSRTVQTEYVEVPGIVEGAAYAAGDALGLHSVPVENETG